jgi:hypothetical protein
MTPAEIDAQRERANELAYELLDSVARDAEDDPDYEASPRSVSGMYYAAAIARALAEAVAQEREACARVCEERRATCCEDQCEKCGMGNFPVPTFFDKRGRELSNDIAKWRVSWRGAK